MGTAGVMTFGGFEIFLEPDRRAIPVPRYLYRIVRNGGTRVNIAYVTFNNIHEEQDVVEAEIRDIFGDDIERIETDASRGYTFKISLKKFLKILKKHFRNSVLKTPPHTPPNR